MTRGVVSYARSQAARKHADRYWDCPCGRRVWGNGGKASHQWACIAAIRQEVEIHEELAASGANAGFHRTEGAKWRRRLEEKLGRSFATGMVPVNDEQRSGGADEGTLDTGGSAPRSGPGSKLAGVVPGRHAAATASVASPAPLRGPSGVEQVGSAPDPTRGSSEGRGKR